MRTQHLNVYTHNTIDKKHHLHVSAGSSDVYTKRF